jgi:predicted ATPase
MGNESFPIAGLPSTNGVLALECSLYSTRLIQMMRLKKISLLKEHITKPREYPFNIPAIASLSALEISSRVCFFVGENIQFIIATHSPILLAYPRAQIFSFDEGKVHQIDYRESQPFRLVSRFVAAPERYINALFSELPFSEN